MVTSYSESGQIRKTATVPWRPLRALALIDGSERTARVIDYTLSLAAGGRQVESVLLGVVREPPDGRLRGYGSFKREEIHAHLKDALAKRAVRSAARRLDQASIAHKDCVEVGEPVETILRIANEEACDLLVIGETAPGRFRRWLPRAVGLAIATTAIELVERSPIPVVVVK